MDIPRPRGARLVAPRIRTVLLGAAALALLAAGLRWAGRARAGLPSVERDRVVLATVQRGTLVRQARGPGALAPEEVWWIAAATDGRVERILIRPGAKVLPDSRILELGNPELEYATRQAELDVRAEEAALRDLPSRLEIERLTEEGALLALASECRRLGVAARADRELSSAGAVPALTRDQSEADTEGCVARHRLAARRLDRLRASAGTRLAAQQARVDSLRALHDLRRRQVEALVVRAGNAGVLEDVPIEVGQRVAIGTTLAKVAPPDRLKAVLRIGEGEAQDLAPGQRATIDLRTGKATGTVTRVEPAVRGGTVTVDVALERPLPAGARSALSVDGVIDLDRATDVLMVGRPMTGEQSTRPGARVGLFRLDPGGGTATRAEVTLGRASATSVEVLSGLEAGDRVILSDMSAWDGFAQIRVQ